MDPEGQTLTGTFGTSESCPFMTPRGTEGREGNHIPTHVSLFRTMGVSRETGGCYERRRHHPREGSSGPTESNGAFLSAHPVPDTGATPPPPQPALESSTDVTYTHEGGGQRVHGPGRDTSLRTILPARRLTVTGDSTPPPGNGLLPVYGSSGPPGPEETLKRGVPTDPPREPGPTTGPVSLGRGEPSPEGLWNPPKSPSGSRRPGPAPSPPVRDTTSPKCPLE